MPLKDIDNFAEGLEDPIPTSPEVLIVKYDAPIPEELFLLVIWYDTRSSHDPVHHSFPESALNIRFPPAEDDFNVPITYNLYVCYFYTLKLKLAFSFWK